MSSGGSGSGRLPHRQDAESDAVGTGASGEVEGNSNKRWASPDDLCIEMDELMTSKPDGTSARQTAATGVSGGARTGANERGGYKHHRDAQRRSETSSAVASSSSSPGQRGSDAATSGAKRRKPRWSVSRSISAQAQQRRSTASRTYSQSPRLDPGLTAADPRIPRPALAAKPKNMTSIFDVWQFSTRASVHTFRDPDGYVSRRVELKVDMLRRRLCLAHVLLGTLGIGLMIVDLEVSYNSATHRIDRGTVGNILSVAIFCTNLALCICVILFYVATHTPHAHENEHWFKKIVFRHRWIMVLELFICIIGPMPGVNSVAFNKVGLLMFLRIYLLARFLHYQSNHYRNRNRYGGQTLDVSMSSTFKRMFFLSPSLMVAAISFVAFLSLSFSVYVVERECQEAFSQYSQSMWYVVVSMSTVGYGDIVTKSTLGNLVSSIIILSGLAITALAVGLLTNALVLSTHQKMSLSLSVKEEILERRAIAAGKLIWTWYTFKKQQRIAESKGTPLSFRECARHSRHMRRLRTELTRVCDSLLRHLRDNFSNFDIIVDQLNDFEGRMNQNIREGERLRHRLESRLDSIEEKLNLLLVQRHREEAPSVFA